jgi:hypothetical protein
MKLKICWNGWQKKKWVARVARSFCSKCAAWLKLSEGMQNSGCDTESERTDYGGCLSLVVYGPMHGSHFSAFIEKRIETGLLISCMIILLNRRTPMKYTRIQQ